MTTLLSGRAIIGTPLWTSEATWSGAGWHIDYPVGQMGTLPLCMPARAIADGAYARATFSRPRYISEVAVCGHTGVRGDRARVIIYAAVAAGRVAWDSGWQDMVPQLFSAAPWSDLDHFWAGTYTPEELDRTRQYTLFRTALPNWSGDGPLWLDDSFWLLWEAGDVAAASLPGVFGDAVEVQFSTSFRGDVGYLAISGSWELEVNFEQGAQLSLNSNATFQTTDGFIDIRPSLEVLKRTFEGQIQEMEPAQAWERFYEFQRRCGLTRPFLFSLTPADPVIGPRTTFLARLSRLGSCELAVRTAGQMALTEEL